MSDFRESLRHAVLANIVAAANREFNSTYTAMGIQSIGTMRNSLDVDTVSKGESNVTLFQNEENISTTPPAPPNTAESPKKAQTLNRERARNTISQGLFTPRGFSKENSCLDVNTELANMVNFRTRKNIEIGCKTANVKPLETVSEYNPTLLTRSQRSPTLRSIYDPRFKFNSNGEPISSYALCGTGLNNVVSKDHVTSAQVRTEINVSQNVGAANKPNLVSHDSNRSQGKEHQSYFGTKIQTNLTKSEQFKKRTEEAKCDAINTGDPIASYILYGASQSKNTSRRDSYGATKETTRGTPPYDKRTEHPNYNVGTSEPLFLNRETKEINNLDLAEGFKVISLNAEFSTIPKPHTTHTNGQLKLRNKFLDDMQNNTRSWTQENIIANSIPTGEAAHHTVLPSYLDVRQLTTSQSQFTRNRHSGRKSMLGNRRSQSLNIPVRDKLRSISPGTGHNSFDNHTKSNEDFSLVGQSIPSFSSDKKTVKIYNRGLKTPLSERKLESWEIDESFQASCRDSEDNITTQEAPHQNEVVSYTPRTLYDVNRKQKCEDKVVARISPSHTNSVVMTTLRSSQIGTTKMELETRPHRYYTNDTMKKLNGCFTHDSSESVLDDETLTMRSLIDQALEPNYLDLRSSSPRNTVNDDQKVPMYMGCSSQVARGISTSQLHGLINKCGKGTDIGQNTKVIKALDPDVYSDYQHKKYRDTNMTTNLNTGSDQPTMHFLKIKVTGDGI